ncbi:HNH endonuclease [Shewanella violacea]|uniref:HNH nuclease domain-containing protein n=1 Tax=Shewanella violacea (strain JCM 10179 / CIP 106290 / LMG 19151 / DSS12) TaxID=637905 RepID=D4ZMF9_SHEVD|nr:HNH endonuclease [Shewanella violacea]BAJ02858.1 hypothetical protein SVI_2887 [Shewanella violacea DSS12]
MNKLFIEFLNKPRAKLWFKQRPHMIHLFEHIFNQLSNIYDHDKINDRFIRSQNKRVPHLLFNLNAKNQEVADNPNSEFGNAIWIKPRYNTSKLTDQYIVHVEVAISFKEHHHHFISFHSGIKSLINSIKENKLKNFDFEGDYVGEEFINTMMDTVPAEDLSLIERLNKDTKKYFKRFPRRQNDFRRLIRNIEREHNITGVKAMEKNCVSSHIKPFSHCKNYEEAHDEYNGLWLEKKMDQLFDKGYITFTKDGDVIVGSACSDELLVHLKLKRHEIHNISPLLKEQLVYMEYHRNAVFKP